MSSKPTCELEALQFTGHNDAECLAFCDVACDLVERGPSLIVPTEHGLIRCEPGAWLVLHNNGQFDVHYCAHQVSEIVNRAVNSETHALAKENEAMALTIEKLSKQLANPEDIRLRSVINVMNGRAEMFHSISDRVDSVLTELDDWTSRASSAERTVEDQKQLLISAQSTERELRQKLEEVSKLAEERLAHRNQLQAEINDDHTGRLELRKQFGAKDDETMAEFINRLFCSSVNTERPQTGNEAAVIKSAVEYHDKYSRWRELESEKVVPSSFMVGGPARGYLSQELSISSAKALVDEAALVLYDVVQSYKIGAGMK